METNCAFQWIEIYPVDSATHLLNKWGQMNHYPAEIYKRNHFATLQTRKGLEHRNGFWDRYWRRAVQLLVSLFPCP